MPGLSARQWRTAGASCRGHRLRPAKLSSRPKTHSLRGKDGDRPSRSKGDRMVSTTRRFTAASLGAAILLAAAALALPARAATFVEALPAATPVPVTATSHPWLYYKTTLRPLDLDKAGYVEEEYLISGNANVYDWDPDPAKDLQVKYRNAPYTTRILVRRPKDAAKFSGNVLVETMNPARPFDMPIMFGWVGPEVLAHGDVWVGVSMGPVMESLKRFDSSRYA